MSTLNPDNLLDRILLYWQTEDLIRAYQFDVNKLVKIDALSQQNTQVDASVWLQDFVARMEDENVKASGHTSHSTPLIDEMLERYHRQNLSDKNFDARTKALKPAINAYNKQRRMVVDDVTALLELTYAYYMQKMAGGEIPEAIENLATEAIEILNELSNA
ncbi:DUF4924 family protein [bacterium]|nr:DUF4924 family protein [bacterium]